MTTISRTRTMRMLAGLALCAAGLAAFFARPGVALAHHVTVTEGGDCSGWFVRAEYIGGGDDRMVVVDVTVNGEAVQQTFYFDNAPGHLGHQDYWLLFERTGSGAVHASGTIIMYAPDGGAYTDIVDSDAVAWSLVCEDATATPTSSPTATATATPTTAPTSTPSAVPTATATATISPPATDTPEPTETPFREDVTPLPSATATAAPSSPTAAAHTATATPQGSMTATPAGDTTTAIVTPTFVDSVLGITPTPRGSDTAGGPPPRTGNAFPSTGRGTDVGSMAWAFASLLLAGAGLALASTGLRLRGEER